MIKLSQVPIRDLSKRPLFSRRRPPALTDVIRIAVVGTRGFPNVQGGVEAHCEQLYPRLAERGYHVTVFAREQYLGISQPYMYKGVHVVPLSCVKNKFLEAFLHTIHAILVAPRYKPDILHIHAIGPSFFAWLGRLLGMKVIVTNHGPDYERIKWGWAARTFLRISEQLGFIFSSRVIAIAPHIKKRHARFAPKMSFIPNGVTVDDNQYDDDVIRQFGLRRTKYILSVGRFVPEKGFIDLINAFELFQGMDPHTEIKLVIVGKADHETAYSLLLEQRAKVNRNIVLTGYLSGRALQEMYRNAGLFVLSSYHEGLSLALLEALGCGVSCIATDIASNHIVELDPSRYYAVGSAETLAASIRHFIRIPLSDTQRHTQMRMIRERFDWNIIARETDSLYRALVLRPAAGEGA